MKRLFLLLWIAAAGAGRAAAAPAPPDGAPPAVAPADTAAAAWMDTTWTAALRRDTTPAYDRIWTDPAAAADSVARYWRGVDRDWYTPLTPADIGLPGGAARYDSLVSAADRLLARMRDAHPWRFALDWWPAPGFQRVDGWRLSLGARLERAGAGQPHLAGRLGWAFSRERLLWDVTGRWPLWRARPLDRRGRLRRAPWTALAVTARARRATVPFGVEPGAAGAWGALVYGSDPAHYFEEEGWRLGLDAAPRPWLTVAAGCGRAEHRPLSRHTTWTLLGDAADVEGNLPVAGLTRRTWDLGVSVRRWRLSLDAALAWHRVTDSPLAPVAHSAAGRAWYRRLDVTGRTWRDDPWGGRWTLRGGWQSVDRTAPAEWAVWLGGFDRLRGYPSRELGGDRGGWLSLDWALNADPLAMVPLLRRLHLQPVLLADYARVWRHGKGGITDPADPSAPPAGAAGRRADLGIALQARVGLIGLVRAVRLTAAHPVGWGQGGRDWRLTLRLLGD